MPLNQKKKKYSRKQMQRGTVGSFFVFGMLALLIVAGMIAVGGMPPDTFPNSGTVVNAVSPTPSSSSHNTLQLQTFGYVTIAPTSTKQPGLCQSGGVNNEPEIIAGYSPSTGQTVGATGQIIVWVQDEGAPFIAPGEQVNLTTGQITSDPNQGTKAPDNYLWEPALYLDSNTAETGGTPHFPSFIKGQFSNTAPVMGNVITGATADPIPAGTQITPAQSSRFGNFFNWYTAEYIWNVSSLGLTTGNHQAEFLIHDGDRDRGVGCVQINIQ